MKTKIYESRPDFYARENKFENGVSKEFAELNPKFEAQNESNESCWNCSGCSGCYDCSACSGCSGCSHCYDCSGCSCCSRCSDCSDLKNAAPVASEESAIKIPTIENIHQKVLAAIKADGCKLEMGDWHDCGTTHCRGGWVINLAGKEGFDLEKKTSSEFAAMAIYSKSSPIKVSPVRFYEDNDVAMKDIERCAKEEAEL